MSDRSPDPAAFDAGWLALREPVDHRSRATELLPPLRARWRRSGWRRVVDLGSGTGSTLRYLHPRLPGPQSWLLVDRDRGLLDRVSLPPDPSGDLRVELREADLEGPGLDAVLHGDLATASALLDLVGEGWMRRWVEMCVRAGCGVYATLTYDGTVRWEGVPPDTDDGFVLAAVNEHQRSDKGTGPALGPDAVASAEALLGDRGWATWTAPSPWRLDGDDRTLARALVDGWAAAALEARPGAEARVRGWARRRLETVASGDFRLVVGHRDLLALPPAPGSGAAG